MDTDIQIHQTCVRIDFGNGADPMVLNNEDFIELHAHMTEARLAMMGRTVILIPATELETGDAIPEFGPISEVIVAHHKTYVMFSDTKCEIMYPTGQFVVAHRVIR